MTRNTAENFAIGAAYCCRPVVITRAVGLAGLGAGGIVTGTPAAAIRATYGGMVGAGCACAVLQFVGAVGLGAIGSAVFSALGCTTAAAGANLRKNQVRKQWLATRDTRKTNAAIMTKTGRSRVRARAALRGWRNRKRNRSGDPCRKTLILAYSMFYCI
ncbi:hypothetical protein BC939DRAFT_165238 [Gamsiella multidivaricata]|uniref:uncharacterized protein n=1 Tax=Gamsiella multidivaricata TaxID=101098 RepID=UPI00221FE5C1|nr:uncharacterized protein BC939DRAFT_165238 [Gamsiella multidivaricata]KAI7823394.1 hypothetical protein BC939DRAFT_165238 [Gamsiella multidivaricata]